MNLNMNMHINLEKKTFLKALSKVHSVAERKHALAAILANVKIVAEGQQVELYATDNDINIISYSPAEILTPGVITIPAHLLYDIIKKLPDIGVITIKKNQGVDTVTLQTANSEFQLPSLPADEFPAFQTGEYQDRFELDSKAFRSILATTKHAISLEEIRYYLNGVYLHTDSHARLSAVATDGHRMAVADMDMAEGSANVPGVIVPKKTIQEIIGILEEAEGNITVELYTNKMVVITPDTKIISTLIEGNFPDYKRIIPTQHKVNAIIPREQLSKAINLVITVSADKTKSVKLNFTPGKLQVFVNSQNNAFATQEILGVEHDAEAPMEIAFNSRYLLDILSVITSETVQLLMTSSQNAVLIKNPQNELMFFILMPMQLTAPGQG